MIFGIDPGNSGAIACIRPDGAYVAHLPMPTIKIASQNRVNGAVVADFLRQHAEDQNHAFIESVAAMPGQGVKSMFTFGHAAGVVEGLIQGLGIPYNLITPVSWKKKAGLSGQNKDAARSRAIMLYPHLRALDAVAKGQALADALLIARIGLTLERATYANQYSPPSVV